MMKILLVDDDAFLRDMYAMKFGEEKYDVSVAKNAIEAISLITEGNSFDVVLMDMVMPGMTGVDLLKEISKSDLKKKPVCIVLSNQGEDSDINAATEAGADGYIIKAETIPSDVVKQVSNFVSKGKRKTKK